MPAQQGMGQVAGEPFSGMAGSGHIISRVKHPPCLPLQAEKGMLGFEPGSVNLFICLFVYLPSVCRLGLGLEVGQSCVGQVRACPGCKKQSDRAKSKVHPS